MNFLEHCVMESNRMRSFVFELFPSAQLLRVINVVFTFCFSLCHGIDVLQFVLPFTSWWTFEMLPFFFSSYEYSHTRLCVDMFSFIFGKEPEMGFVGHIIGVCFNFMINFQCFSSVCTILHLCISHYDFNLHFPDN